MLNPPQYSKNYLERLILQLSFLKGMGSATFDNVIIFLLSTNLEDNMHKQWQSSLDSSVEPPKLDDLAKFVNQKISTLEAWEQRIRPTSSGNATTSKNPAKGVESLQTNQKPADNSFDACVYCKADHFILRCPIFQKFSPRERQKKISGNQLCV